MNCATNKLEQDKHLVLLALSITLVVSVIVLRLLCTSRLWVLHL